jgi:hypothetical protein
MHLDDHACLGADCTTIVVEIGSIGRSYFEQPRATLPHDVRNSEAPADLDQLAPRDDCVAPIGDGIQRQDERRRAVVDDERVVGAGELAQQCGAVNVS